MKRIFILIFLCILISGCTSGMIASPAPTLGDESTQISTSAMQLPIPAEDQQSRIVELLLDNDICELPCLWGITPGSTSWSDASRSMNEYGIALFLDERSGWNIYYTSLLLSGDEKNISFSIKFFVISGVVDHIQIQVGGFYNPDSFISLMKKFLPENIFTAYGSPSRIIVQTNI